MGKQFGVTLRKIRRLSQSTLWFRFERNDGELVSFEQGQFFRFEFSDKAGDFERAYSPCNFGQGVADTPYLDLVVSYVDGGRASQYLFHCDEGIAATVGGPFGRLVVPKKLPALLRARRIQEKAANVGFDWDELSPVLDKIDEEVAELKEAVESKNPENIKDEMGDVLFSLVNLSRFLDINPEDALRMTISKFETRFSQVEQELKKRGKSLTDSTLEEMDEIWNLVKKKARA